MKAAALRRRRWLALFRMQLRLDMLVAFALILAAASLQMMVVMQSGTLQRARLVEALLQLHPPRGELVERIALTGGIEDPAAADTTAGGGAATRRRIASARELEETQAGIARAELLALDVDTIGLRRKTSASTVTALVDGIPVVATVWGESVAPTLLELRPVLHPQWIGTVNWVCGRQRHFAGVAGPLPREPAVSPDLLPGACRGEGR